MLGEITFDTEEKESCKGQVYRCHTNRFVNSSGSYVEKTTMRKLKTKSCRGCETCGYLDDDLREQLSYGEGIDIRPSVCDGEVYRLMVVDVSTDWETGIVDDWSVAFVLIEED